MRAEVIAAAWEAEWDFDPTRGVPLPAFVYGRIWARARTRYRQERAYARRCGLQPERNDCEELRSEWFASLEDSVFLRRWLDRLPERERRLIQGMYWDEKTQVEVARMLSLSQPAVSKLNRQILAQLRRGISQSEKGGTLGRKP
jgi:RNA polymerase sigma factor (sigma-70 family)